MSLLTKQPSASSKSSSSNNITKQDLERQLVLINNEYLNLKEKAIFLDSQVVSVIAQVDELEQLLESAKEISMKHQIEQLTNALQHKDTLFKQLIQLRKEIAEKEKLLQCLNYCNRVAFASSNNSNVNNINEENNNTNNNGDNKSKSLEDAVAKLANNLNSFVSEKLNQLTNECSLSNVIKSDTVRNDLREAFKGSMDAITLQDYVLVSNNNVCKCELETEYELKHNDELNDFPIALGSSVNSIKDLILQLFKENYKLRKQLNSTISKELLE